MLTYRSGGNTYREKSNVCMEFNALLRVKECLDIQNSGIISILHEERQRSQPIEKETLL